ncbi:MAG TPA: hypothetical protein VFZ42_16955 [Chitinophagaceae bacterium]
MKILYFISFLLCSTALLAQNEADYNNLLKKTKEIVIVDSILVEVTSVEHIVLDTNTLKNYFQMFYPPLTTRRSSAMEYYISGKITTNPNYNMLLVSTRKEEEEEDVYSESVYLLTTKKDGSNISAIAIATKREKNAIVNTSSWLHKDNRVFVTTRINSKGKLFGGLTEYRISEDGRFINHPHWTK